MEKQAKSIVKSKTVLVSVGTFLVGLITYLTGSDLWGMIPEGNNATEVLIMVQSAIMFILRFFTEGGIAFKK